MSVWDANTGADVALTAATAKTVIGVKAPTGAIVTLPGVHISFESVTASDATALIEIVRGAADGTGTTVTPVNRKGGHTAAASFAAKHTYTVEPASLTVAKEYQYPVQGSAEIILDFGAPIESAVAGFIGVRVTTPAGQVCRASITVTD